MRIDKEIYTSHIRDNEKLIEMRKVLDKIENVLNNHTVESTDFLDPYEGYLAKSILHRFDDIQYFESGGLPSCERRIFSIAPDYLHENDLKSNLTYLRINGDIQGLSHKDYLGAVLNLGIKRSKIGDILLQDDYTDIIVKDEISNFILFNLEKVANKKVEITEIHQVDLKEPELNFKEVNKFLPSLRLDVVLSNIYNLSRTESMNIIKSGNVKVNWEPIDKSSKELEVGDTISTRGYGRAKLHSIDGISKKGNIHVSIRILI